MERIETVVIGGGQAGLATSYYLKQAGREHVVLEQASQAAPVWSTGRWDSFTLVTPNWSVRMPGAEYNGSDRDGFMTRDELIAYFDRYVEQVQPPIQYNTRVMAVEASDTGGYRIHTDRQSFEADNVVMATGFEQQPTIPAFATDLSPEITQLHSSRYQNQDSLPPGAVLVVGSAQSGGQIAEELYRSGRQVYLSTGSTGRVPRRYRGKDVFEWLVLVGFFDLLPEKFPFPIDTFSPPHLSGTNGGHTLNLHQFARDGVGLLGHISGVAGKRVTFAPDLHQNLTQSDQFELMAKRMIDGFIEASGLDAPAEELPQLRDGFEQRIIEELDLSSAGIATVLWATGYRMNFDLLKLPVINEKGFPIQTNGVARSPGLYFVGMPWTPTMKPVTLAGVGESAKRAVDHIVGAPVEAVA